MEVVSLCALPVAPLYWLPQAGACALTVIVKATFDIHPGEATLARVQDPIHLTDRHHDDDPRASVYAPCDLVPFKPMADVVVVGNAYAASGQPVRHVAPRFIVGSVDKGIDVYLDRHWTQDGELVEAARFLEMPLRWELARGGPDTNNPVGIARDAPPDPYGRVRVPNLVAPGQLIGQRSDVIDVVGVGPIATTWSVREKLLGHHVSHWSHTAWNEHPIPPDIDGAFFCCAPLDQRTDEIRDNERIVLERLHPDEPRVVCHLPGVRPKVCIERGGALRELALVGDTLWIDTVRAVCTVTWRGRLDVQSPAEEGRVLVAMVEPGQQLSVARMQQTANALGRSAPPVAEHGAQGLEDDTEGPRTARQDDAYKRPTLDLESVTAIGPESPVGESLPFTAAVRAVRPRAAVKDVHRSRGETQAMHAFAPAAPQISPAWFSSALQPAQGSFDDEDDDPLSRTVLGLGRPMPQSPWAGEPAEPSAAPALATPVPLGATPVPLGSVPTAPGPVPLGPGPVLLDSGRPPAAAPMAAPPPPPLVVPGAMGGARAIVPNPAVQALGGGNLGAGQALMRGEDLQADAEPPSSPRPEPRVPAARAPAREIVELIWFDADALPKIRDDPRFAELLAELNAPPSSPPPLDFDDDPPPEESPELRDRRDVVGIMTRGHITTGASLRTTMLEAVDESGSFEPPIVLMSGRLEFPFDELETLKATLTAVTPFTAGNKRLKDTVDMVKELMQTPWLESSGEVARNQTHNLREAFKSQKTMDAAYLDNHTERMLLEKRHYQKREVFGDAYLRALVTPSMAKEATPTYITAKLARDLPMFQSFDARIIAEAHVQQDQYESQQEALKVVAVGRVIRFVNAAQLH